jgi:hypothetical protein
LDTVRESSSLNLWLLLSPKVRLRAILVEHFLYKVGPIVLFDWLSNLFLRVIVKKFLILLLIVQVSTLDLIALLTGSLFQRFEIIKSFLLITLVEHVLLVKTVVVVLGWLLVALSYWGF